MKIFSFFYCAFLLICKPELAIADNPLHVYKATENGLVEQPELGTCNTIHKLELVIPPKIYCFSGKKFNLTDGGYRVIKIGTLYNFYIVHNGTSESILKGLAWATQHGSTDNKYSNLELESLAKRKKLSLTCGHITRLATSILNKNAYKTRKVIALTLDKWNTYDNSHTLFELYDSKNRNWFIVDLDNNIIFKDYQNKKINAKELFDDIADGKIKTKFVDLANDSKVDPAFDYAFIAENITSTFGLKNGIKECFRSF